jgi:hypothetical protein
MTIIIKIWTNIAVLATTGTKSREIWTIKAKKRATSFK